MRHITAFVLTILVVFNSDINLYSQIKKETMTHTTEKTEETLLTELNAQFIRNFIAQDAIAHSQILHKNFICIQSNGSIVGRDKYLKEWATGYKNSGYTSFTYTDELIRIFGIVALVRSKTVYTKIVNGVTVSGNSVYTDTYAKENGKWLCVQAQITSVSK